MTEHRYLHLDVFTRTPLRGNQLAVFLDPPDWSDATRQDIAREMAFSETTFVHPPKSAGALASMRIFTPAGELPMAGHPTIGTTFALAASGRIGPRDTAIVLDLGVGPTPVDLEWQDGALDFAWMQQPLPEFGAVIEDRAAVAAALGLERSELAETMPVQVVSCAVPFAFVALRSRDAVDRAALDRGAWQRACAAAGIAEQKVFLFSIDGENADGETSLYSRMFGAIVGIAEDPGTGGASGPLGSYLVRRGAASEAVARFLSHQGVKMQRPCEISIRIARAGGAICRVQIGGAAIVVGEATLRF